MAFEKNANYFCRKLAKIAENCDHNIDPCFQNEFIERPSVDLDCQFQELTLFVFLSGVRTP
jgi:hypothetical protein